jgi:flagellar basal-body rod modification protein FlgD
MNQVSPFSELFPSAQPAKAAGPNSVEELGSDDFLALMVAQLENQDPTKPMDNMQFIAQLAQFGSVSGIQELNDAFGGLSSALTGNQALQAASLVGRDVVTETNVGTLREFVDANGDVQGFLDATVEFGGSTSGGNLLIQDMTGRLVYSTALPPSQGDLKVRWDGLDSDGNALPPGRYRVSAEAMINGQSQSVSVHAHQQVQSVAVDGTTGQLTLELGDGSDVTIDEVLAFL